MPAVQDTHAPAEQTWFVPQLVPSGWAVVVELHTGPVLQLVVPTWHGSAGGVHVWPAVQAVHVPAEQTRFVPQTVPSATGVVVAVQTGLPEASHVYEATWHRSEGTVQTPPGVQVHAPLEHVIAVPQLVPFGWFAPVSVQTEVPVEHDVAPT